MSSSTSIKLEVSAPFKSQSKVINKEDIGNFCPADEGITAEGSEDWLFRDSCKFEKTNFG